MRRKGKVFTLGFVVAIVLSLSLNLVQAEDSYNSIRVELNKVNIAINGVIVGSAGMDYTLADGSTVPFSILYNGTTYLPMRKVAELIGMDVSWNAATSTAGINKGSASTPKAVASPISSNKTEQSLSNIVISAELNKINIAIDGSVVGQAGMNYTLANGEQVPYSILYKGTTYLPMRKVAELVGKEVAWDSATNTAGINDIKIPVEPVDGQTPEVSTDTQIPAEPTAEQTPAHIEETKPIINPGQALLKVNFKLPEGSAIMNEVQEFTIVCDTVSSNGSSKKEFSNIFMSEGSNSYTAYILIDTSGGSASCRIYYQAYSTSGYISGFLTDQGTEVLPRALSPETDRRKIIEVKEGAAEEVTLDAIKGILFSTTIKWSGLTPLTLKPSQIGVEFTEKSKDGNVENIVTTFYNLMESDNEKEVLYTFAQDKEYTLAFYNKEAKFYYIYGNINISDEAVKTGQLAYEPIVFSDVAMETGQLAYIPIVTYGVTEDQKQLLQEKIKEIIARIIEPGMSDIDKEYAIFEYIQNNTVYGFTPNCGNAYGSLVEGVSVCQGYAEGTKKLLDAAGIENQIAYGVKRNGIDEAPHAWNIVKIGGEYFHLEALHNRFNLNDTDAKSEYYTWQEGSIPACNSRFSITQGMGFFAYNGYIYYTSGEDNMWHLDISRCRPDGSENTRLFTTKNASSYIFQCKGWIYYFEYEGSEVYRVRTDGSEEALIYSFDKDVRFHDGGIYNNALYLFAQTGVSGAYKMNIIKFDLESFKATTIATLDYSANMWNVGDYFYYYREENGQYPFFRMTLDGSTETRIYPAD